MRESPSHRPGMPRRPENEPLGSPALQELYGEGYFHGSNSGFAHEGYDRVHATWDHWMPWLRQEVGAGARWLDLGCAYGFLVADARENGFRAFGMDASGFALAQAAEHAPDASGRLVQGHAEVLPFADEAFDVVTAFDLLEHVPDPECLLAEVARILRPGGVFLAATPDALVFDREEPTHISEHVPSWWVRACDRAGLSTALRFFQAEYNCELIARRGGAVPEISFDGFARETVVDAGRAPGLRVALRRGFGAAEPDGGRVVEEGAAIYLLNEEFAPLSVRLRLRLRDPVGLCLRLDGRLLEVARKECGAYEVDFLLSRGGHGLVVGLDEGWACLLELVAEAEPVDHRSLCLTMPFDLYERYALSAGVLEKLGVREGTLLDVGGTMGGAQGHLGWTGDFFPCHAVTVIDTRAADVPEHRTLAIDGPLPFEDRSFETVVSQDVLEHVPSAAREAWLEEIWRVTGRLLLLACPWSTPGVEEADRALFDRIRREYDYDHGFLGEHLAHGHPDLAATRRFFEGRGASVVELPSGDLSIWTAMQAINARLSHPCQGEDYRRANEALNRQLGARAAIAPAYRHLLVIDREGRENGPCLADLPSAERPDLTCVAEAVSDPTIATPREWRLWTRSDRGAEEPLRIALAIVSCNGRALLESCLASIGELDYPSDRIEILVYDNGSSDGTIAWLEQNHPEVRVLAADRNEGFAAPCNRLARAASSSYVCFLNNDVQVEPDFLTALTSAARRTGAACIGARVLSADGDTIEFDGGTMNFLGHGAPLRSGARACDHAADVEPVDSLFACGAAMLVEREAFLEAGGFDESYFAYFEDVDFGWRLWTMGERCVVAPAARVRHREHGSESLLPPGRRLALLERNALLSVVKNYEEERAARVLRCGLALLAERERLAPDPERRSACREGLFAATTALPAAERRAVELRRRRRRTDAEIAALFRDPWRPPIAGDRYARRQVEVARVFGACDLFDPAPQATSEGDAPGATAGQGREATSATPITKGIRENPCA